MSSAELEIYLQELSSENPMIEITEYYPEVPPPSKEKHDAETVSADDGYYYHSSSSDNDNEYNPLDFIATSGGFEETLEHFLFRQLDKMNLTPELLRMTRYISACLDEYGYMRFSLKELAAQINISVSVLEQAVAVIRSLEPAGVGASDLSQCLELQLKAVGYDGPAMHIVRHHLDDLSKHRYQAISNKLGISIKEVREAEAVIQQLEPRPGTIFSRYEQPNYIRPDIIVTEVNGEFTATSLYRERKYFDVSEYYISLLSKTDDKETKEYLKAKLRQAEDIRFAINQRESTLMRCAKLIVEYQQGFFRNGPQALVPLRMADIAHHLEIHESTVSRAIREKYLQCHFGIYPLRYFFSRNISADTAGSNIVGAAAVKSMIKKLIDDEDKNKPLSDQRLCDILSQQGYVVSRRTIAKYRDEMNIPSVHGRKQI